MTEEELVNMGFNIIGCSCGCDHFTIILDKELGMYQIKCTSCKKTYFEVDY